MSLARALIVAIPLFALGCDDATTDLGFLVTPTEIAVDPIDALGDLRCSPHEGAPKSYVVSLTSFDSADDSTPFPLGSSFPASCARVSGFREVIVVGQRYTAEVDIYDLPPEGLAPFGGSNTGGRQMLNSITGQVVKPRWTTRCGSGDETAVLNRRVFMRPCEAPADSAPTPTEIIIGPAQVLGESACDLSDKFTIAPESDGAGPAVELACDAPAARYPADPDTSQTFHVSADFDGVIHGTACTATARLGQTVPVVCGKLSSTAMLRVALHDIRNDDAPVCPDDAFFEVRAADDTLLTAQPAACGQQALVGPFEPGPRTLRAIVYDGAGEPVGKPLECSATAVAGRVSQATCRL